ncbi:hypothetical protein AGMMS49545_12150 [Betaproteobacteria bacterium]|nr:hypothetical protein AGMMS49545_12150 [Betaproteobacteria bacterium]GHU42653.1 hypothetical protein AGMMS50289_07730 [Betaproteobacteria bacterium]
MSLLDTLVEQRIKDASARGEFNNLPGQGAPLLMEDDLLTPEEHRVANRILKNAGLTPPAVESLRHLRTLRHELAQTANEAEQRRLRARILALDLTLESARGHAMRVPESYRQAMLEKLGATEKPETSGQSHECRRQAL